MTRQVVPSIVLSVLIVCFLRLHSINRTRPVRDGAPIKNGRQIARTGSTQASGRSSGARTRDVPPRRPTPLVATRTEPRAHQRTALGFTSEVVHNCGEPIGPSAGQFSKRGLPREAGADRTDFGPPPTARKRQPIDADFGPRRSFTVVKAGETLGDVARRVYGPPGRPARSGGPIATPSSGDSPLAVGCCCARRAKERETTQTFPGVVTAPPEARPANPAPPPNLARGERDRRLMAMTNDCVQSPLRK